jgi:hypothetical protein|nr:hypothetical protein [Neorhizobium tomejilense]
MEAPLPGTIDEAVAMALAEELDRHVKSGSVRDLPPRVLVRDGGSLVARRPFRYRGSFSVLWAGTARLVEPRRENGVIVFRADWS